MRIAIDIGSGDNPAGELVAGVLEAIAGTDAEVALVGEKKEIFAALSGKGSGAIEIVEAEGVVEMEESPVQALAKKPRASVAVAADLVAEGKADIFLSPGNTGASMVVASQKLKRIPGVLRPALAAPLVNAEGRPAVILDVGASSECNSRHMAQYGVMGAAYAEGVLGVDGPKVSLLNSGTEPGKGTDLYKKSHDELAAAGLNFSGNIEGFDLFYGKAEVVVVDGFTGNILVKSMESVALGTIGILQKSMGGNEGFVKAASEFSKKIKQVGGIPLLGVQGGCLIMHGRSGPDDMREAVKTAVKILDGEVGKKIEKKLEEYGLRGENE